MTNAKEELSFDQLDQVSGGQHPGRPYHVGSSHRAYVILNRQINASIDAAVKSLGSIHLF